jgi:hypothetical protein
VSSFQSKTGEFRRGLGSLRRGAAALSCSLCSVWLLTLVAVLPLFAAAALPLPAQDSPQGAAPAYHLEIPGDATLLSRADRFVEVPILLQHNGAGSFDNLHIGLDYDELVLRFEGGVSLDDSIGLSVDGLQHDVGSGRIQLDLEFDPQRGIEEAEVLVRLSFGVAFLTAATEQEDQYDYRQNAAIEIIRDEVYLTRRDKSVNDDRARITVSGGSVTLLVRDMVELDSGALSADTQTFVIPAYVTHLEDEFRPFEVGLDFDPAYLSLVDVELVADAYTVSASGRPLLLTGDVHWFDMPQGESGLAPITVRFNRAVFRTMKRTHLLNLHFRYDGAAGVPPGNELSIRPVTVGVEDSDRLAAGEAIPATGHDGPARLYFLPRQFVRGDLRYTAPGSQASPLNLDDAFALLESLYKGGMTDLTCLEAADINDNGSVDSVDFLHIVRFLFAIGPPPAAPYPFAGPDPDGEGEGLGCGSYGPPTFQLLPMVR